MSVQSKMNSYQRESFVAIVACNSLFKAYKDDFAKVAGRVDNGLHSWKSATAIIEKLISKIVDTIPTEQLKVIMHHMNISEIRVGCRTASNAPDELWVMSRNDLCKLANMAVNAECLTCDNKNRPCELRRIINDLPVDVDSIITCGGD